jgi:hypothetical protein
VVAVTNYSRLSELSLIHLAAASGPVFMPQRPTAYYRLSVHALLHLSIWSALHSHLVERSTASATFVTFFAVTYTAMITRMINGELNYRIPASHSNHVPKGTTRRHVFLFPLCRQVSFHSPTQSVIIISQNPAYTANLPQSKNQPSFVLSELLLPSRPHIQHVKNLILDLHPLHIHVYKHLV